MGNNNRRSSSSRKMAGKLNVTEDPKAHLVRLVKDFDNAMLITKNSSDQLRGRPMRIAKADVEQNLWFITSMDSAKIEELLRDPRACITMQKNSEYISLSGNVHVSNDKGGIEEIWKEAYRRGSLRARTRPTWCCSRSTRRGANTGTRRRARRRRWISSRRWSAPKRRRAPCPRSMLR